MSVNNTNDKIADAILILIFMPNVTGQRTRHLVEGTLDPLVRCIFILLFRLSASALQNRRGETVSFARNPRE